MRLINFVKSNPNGHRDALIIGVLMAVVVLGPLLFSRSFPVYKANAHEFSVVPTAGGEFKLCIAVEGATQLYAWQGKVGFNPNVFAVVSVAAGDFLSKDTLVISSAEGYSGSELTVPGAVLVFTYDAEQGTLLVGATILGSSPGMTGDGALATVAFKMLAAEGNADLGLYGDVILISPNMVDAEGTLSAKITA